MLSVILMEKEKGVVNVAEKDLEKLGEYIKQLRLDYPYKSAELAKKAKVSQSYISDLENAKKKSPKLEVLERISNTLTDKMTKSARLGVYANILSFAGYTTQRNELVHGTARKEENKAIPLADFLKQLDDEIAAPLTSGEFLLTYKESDDKSFTVRSQANSFEALFDLSNFGNTYQVVIEENGLTIYGETQISYKGRTLSDEEIKQVKNLIAAILDK